LSVHGPKLVKMANDIAQFFEAEEDRATMLAGIASHLERFWDPRMRRDLLEWIDHRNAEGLRESVRDAVASRRSVWDEVLAKHAANREG
jgi:formate dehydrogenase subunit delta